MSGNDHDFEIELGKSSSRRFESKPSPLRDGSLCAFPYDRPESDDIPVFISEHAARGIEAHAKENVEIEVGGVLLGAYYRSGNESFIEVTDFIEAAAAKSTGVSLTFTHETWEVIHAEQARRGPGLMIVGWYHTHPGLGVFLSNEDDFIHTSYFADPWQVALVVDPVYENWGCFKWNQGNLTRTGGFYVFGDRKEARRVKDYTSRIENSRQVPSVAVSAAADRRGGESTTPRNVWAAIALLLLLQVVTGWMLLSRKTPQAAKTDHYANAIALLSACDLTGGEQELRAHLTEAPTDSRAAMDLQRLNALMDTSGVSSPTMDRACFLLNRADALAHSRIKPVKRGELEGLISKRSLKLEAADPAAEAFRIYQSARSSRSVRLQRAVLVRKSVRSLLGGRVVRDAWWDKAVRWAEAERLREVAYGLHSGQNGYENIFSNLSKDDQAAVKRIRAGIIGVR